MVRIHLTEKEQQEVARVLTDTRNITPPSNEREHLTAIIEKIECAEVAHE